ncbi:Response regulator receiver domain-containing protein [Paenibacillus sp. 1_12]|uniref:response regulator transcription factor n=1 Tax=Paenibacillus sp. 1_12 TaxID=1566278 RepID=UPI0008E1ADDD|nr:response regulator [Paenibacillus sp. 1_12]SFM29713.1 Response regulator receiver domain-containing protein [Paenibacillus sp. 1_12]
MKVLIIDNERHSREAVKLLVNWRTYGIKEIFEASDTLSAEKITIDKRPNLILSDMERSDENSLPFLLWVSFNFPETSIIITTGHIELSVIKIMKNLIGVINKPVDQKLINEMIAIAVSEFPKNEIQ